ncbi:MAG: hypothetical protein KKC20_24875, partial [Proteobacteria bacterium]|nr:hypothetical protein [Pseudomonadota bacterium]
RKAALEQERLKADAAIEKALAERKKNQEKLDLLAACLPALEIKPGFDAIEQAAQQTKDRACNLERLRADLVPQKALLAAAEEKEKNSQNILQTLKKEIHKTETLITEKVLPLDNLILGHKEQAAALEKQQAELAGRLEAIRKHSQAQTNLQKQALAALETSMAYLADHKTHEFLGEGLPVIEALFDQRSVLAKRLAALGAKDQANQAQRLAAKHQAVTFVRTMEELQAKKKNLTERLEVLALETAAILGDDTRASRQDEYERMVDAIPLQAKLMEISQQFETTRSHKAELEMASKKDAIALDTQSRTLADLSVARDRAKTQVADLDTLLAQEEKIVSLARHRDRLVKGDPCPLCGATEHPAIETYKGLDISDTRARKSNQEKELTALIRDMEKTGQEVARTETRLAAAGQQMERLETILDACGHSWAAICQKLNIALKLTHVQEIKTWLNREETRTRDTRELLGRLDKIKNKTSLLETRLQQVREMETQTRHLMEMGRKQQETLARNTSEMHAARAELAEEVRSLEEKLETKITGLDNCLPDLDSQAAWLVRHQHFRGAWKKARDQSQAAQKQLDRIKGDLALLEKEKSLVLDQKIQVDETFLQEQTRVSGLSDQRRQLFGEKSIQGERRRMALELDRAESLLATVQADKHLALKGVTRVMGGIAELEKTLKDLVLAEEQAKTRWVDLLGQSGFKDQTDFQAALLSTQARNELVLLKETLDKAENSARALAEKTKKELETLTASPLTRLPLEKIVQGLEKNQADSQAVGKRQGEILQRIQDDREKRANQAALFDRIGLQKKRYDQWVCLSSLIGSRDGDKFRRFAQGLTLDHLLYLANKRLHHLHGRYLLARKTGEDLSLEVKDTWQADIVRDTKTLSGGESFLVSLALALALSDLVSSQTSIDSLFLDEGFGSLDTQTLETALDALDNLNSSGKMIGVISHVEAMKERIATQIIVEKKSGLGISQLDARFRA